ncbi:MAG: hypothetical protein M0008_05510 [Actinomycetota bacterium]|nr:hypothetical protein [Actinomycetota bacterium]
MSQPWRYVDCGAVDAFENSAQLPVLVRSVAETLQPTLMTSVWGATHLNVGWFDDVDSTLDLGRCDALGVQVVRRAVYGGGTAFYSSGCAAMWTFLVPKDAASNLDAELARFQPIVLDALAELDLGDVGFEGSSDLRWNGRKLGALSAQDVVVCNSVGGFLNLRPPEMDLYLQVVRVPDEKFKDKAVKDMSEYVVAAEEIRKAPLSYEMFRDALLRAASHAGIDLSEVPLSDSEKMGLEKIAAKVADPRYVRRVSSERFREAVPTGASMGFGNHKGRKLCRAGLAVDRSGNVVAAMMAGDMHASPPDVMDRVSAALVGANVTDTAELRRRIAGIFEQDDVHQADAAMGVTTDDLLAAVVKAAAEALVARDDGSSERAQPARFERTANGARS